jgi:hypothetical protein
MSRIVDLTVTIGPETFSPPSVNKRLTLTSNYRGPGYWRASTVEMVLHTGSHVDFSLSPVSRLLHDIIVCASDGFVLQDYGTFRYLLQPGQSMRHSHAPARPSGSRVQRRKRSSIAPSVAKASMK